MTTLIPSDEQSEVIAYPLRPLGERYEAVVKEDREVKVRRWSAASRTPLIHWFYWSDRRVIRPIAAKHAEAWRALNA